VSLPAPTIEEVDRQLSFWESQVTRVKINLDLLQQAPSYVFISGGLKLTGRTQTEVVAPILAARDLADQYELLAGTVAKARLQRGTIRRFLTGTNAEALREIDRLLGRPSIPLPAAQVPLAQRNLLDDPVSQSHLTLQQLVQIMTQAFASARDAVSRYDEVMATLQPALKAADAQLSSLSERAASLGPQAMATVAPMRSALQQARARALDDPLSASGDFNTLVQDRLRTLTRRLDDMERQISSVRDNLARAQARQSRAERTRGADSSQVAGLREWLDNIAQTVAAGEFGPAVIGLQRWNAAAAGPYAAEEQRQEQLGLLKALRAMAQARRDRGAAIDPTLDVVAMQAESALAENPVDLRRATALVQQYQQGVTRS
jgi:hypothetical protein